MKVLIWFLCLFAAGLVQVGLEDSGIILGGVPTAVLFLTTSLTARALCRRWEESHGK